MSSHNPSPYPYPSIRLRSIRFLICLLGFHSCGSRGGATWRSGVVRPHVRQLLTDLEEVRQQAANYGTDQMYVPLLFLLALPFPG